MKLLFIILLIFTVSCGKNSENSKSKKSTTILEQQSEMKDGEYVAYLRTINSSVNGFIPFGRAEITLKENELTVTTYLDDDQRVMHMQRIHSGSECPTLKDDLNKDGYIDLIEAEKALGSVILPLDNDISSRSAGEGKYPIGSAFFYERSANWSEILADLKRKYKEGYFILKGDDLDLSNRVILIHGTSYSSLVPKTLQTMDGIEPHLSVPVTCGVIRKK